MYLFGSWPKSHETNPVMFFFFFFVGQYGKTRDCTGHCTVVWDRYDTISGLPANFRGKSNVAFYLPLDV